MSTFRTVIYLLRSRNFQKCFLNGRSLLNHLIRTHQLLLKQGFPKEVAYVGLLHSFYGELKGYKADGFRHEERYLLKTLVGEDIENWVYLYHKSIEEGRLFDPFEIKEQCILGRLENKIHMSKETYSNLLNVSFLDIIEQVQFLSDLKKETKYSDFFPYLRRYSGLRHFLTESNRALLNYYFSFQKEKHVG
ncbi:MAG: hypothetical protein R3A11_04820 [Bdellovibrionota bacterium]